MVIMAILKTILKFCFQTLFQVVHHGIMPIFGWALCRWLPGGQESFGGTLNSLVHVLMYSYYFLAALGPHMQKYLWWKRYLTTFQMIQVFIVIVSCCVFQPANMCLALGWLVKFFFIFSCFCMIFLVFGLLL